VTDLRLADVIAALASTRDQLREKAGYADVAIDALSKLLDAAPSPALALPAPPPRAPSEPKRRVAGDVDSHGHQVHGADRPRTTVCKNDRCEKEFSVRGVGRVPHYCSDLCRSAHGKRLHRAVKVRGAAIEEHQAAAAGPVPAPERRRMPRADRPVDDAELDSLLTRGKRGAA
jgi:hypothetical protein